MAPYNSENCLERIPNPSGWFPLLPAGGARILPSGEMNPIALVVENDAGTRKLLEAMLRRLDLDVDLVAAPAAALCLLEAIRYDVVFTELVFPGSHGGDLLAWLEQNQADALGRTVVVTSAPVPQLRKVASQWPAVQRIQKPFELSDILDIASQVKTEPARRAGTAFEEFVRRAVRSGAKAAIIVTLDETTATPVASYGYQSATIDPFLPLSLDANVPICDAIRSRAPVWIAALGPAAEVYPHLVDVWQSNESRALCAVPVVHEGTIVGAAGFSFREPRLFTEIEQQTFLSLADLAAKLIVSGR